MKKKSKFCDKWDKYEFWNQTDLLFLTFFSLIGSIFAHARCFRIFNSHHAISKLLETYTSSAKFRRRKNFPRHKMLHFTYNRIRYKIKFLYFFTYYMLIIQTYANSTQCTFGYGKMRWFAAWYLQIITIIIIQ